MIHLICVFNDADSILGFKDREIKLFAQHRDGIASDLYRQTMTLLVLPPEVKPWERDKTDDDDDGLENTFDRFVRNGQPPVR